MSTCRLCGQPFDPQQQPSTPAQETGAFLAREMYGDAGVLCLQCLQNRGELAMMYMKEFD